MESSLGLGTQSNSQFGLHLPAFRQLFLKLLNLLLQPICNGLGLLISCNHLVQFCLLICVISQVGFMSGLAKLRSLEGGLEILRSLRTHIDELYAKMSSSGDCSQEGLNVDLGDGLEGDGSASGTCNEEKQDRVKGYASLNFFLNSSF